MSRSPKKALLQALMQRDSRRVTTLEVWKSLCDQAARLPRKNEMPPEPPAPKKRARTTSCIQPTGHRAQSERRKAKDPHLQGAAQVKGCPSDPIDGNISSDLRHVRPSFSHGWQAPKVQTHRKRALQLEVQFKGKLCRTLVWIEVPAFVGI